MSAADTTPDEQRLRAEVRKAVLGRICNVSNLPDWMQTPALGRNMGPLAETVVDALLPIIAADRERYAQQRAAEARVEALSVAAVYVRQIVNYWDGRPTEHHGHHIEADLRDVLRAIEADRDHNAAEVTP